MGGKQAQGVQKWAADKDIRASRGESDRKLEKTIQCGASWLYSSPTIKWL